MYLIHYLKIQTYPAYGHHNNVREGTAPTLSVPVRMSMKPWYIHLKSFVGLWKISILLCLYSGFLKLMMTKTPRDTCLPSGHSSSSVWAVTSWAEFNQEGHHVCLAHKTTDTLAFSPGPLNPILLFPFQICTEAAQSVMFSYSISCQGLESDQSGIVKRVRSTPRLLTIQRS